MVMFCVPFPLRGVTDAKLVLFTICQLTLLSTQTVSSKIIDDGKPSTLGVTFKNADDKQNSVLIIN